MSEGAEGVELDVRLTADGVPVVFHDATLARLAEGGDVRFVKHVRYMELPSLSGGERIPRLSDALEAMRGYVVNVEVKSDITARTFLSSFGDRVRLAQATSAVVKAFDGRVDVLFSSFDPAVLIALALALPHVPRAILLDAATPRMASALPLALRRCVVAAHLEESLATDARVDRLRRASLCVGAWTVNSSERAEELVALGVTRLITDCPGYIKAALTRSIQTGPEPRTLEGR